MLTYPYHLASGSIRRLTKKTHVVVSSRTHVNMHIARWARRNTSKPKTLREEMRKSGKTDGGKGKSKDKENKPKGPGRTPSTDSKDGKRRQTPVATPAARTDDETSGKLFVRHLMPPASCMQAYQGHADWGTRVRHLLWRYPCG